ncbi:MAG: stage II sporulation protein M [Candidatus Pacearchaeota archaeon]|nr:stage II sporulation protein M [Candidatus Pacearchaeota archaeon]
MLKILFESKKANSHPIQVMFIGIFYSTLSIFLGSWIFPQYSSLIIVFFTVLPCVYLIQSSIKIEETKDKNYIKETHALKSHSKVVKTLLYLFIGFVISFTFWTFILPLEKTNLLFDLQLQVIEGIRTSTVTGNFLKSDMLELIISNNLKVLLVSLIISLFYSAGAIFVIAWNASVMGVVIGTLLKNTSLIYLPVATVKYFLHGIPEMLSYITIVLAGGILYTSIIKGDILKEQKTKRILIDTITLIGISILLIFLAGIIEVYISALI